MNIVISDYESVAKIQDTCEITKTLSIIEFNPNAAYSKTSPSKNTFIQVSDHETVFSDMSPNKSTIKQIIEFAETIEKDDNVLIHCLAGVSRSTAAALIVIFHHTRDEKNAAMLIKAIRPQAAPNRLIARLADEYYGHGNKLYTVANELNESRFINLTNNKR